MLAVIAVLQGSLGYYILDDFVSYKQKQAVFRQFANDLNLLKSLRVVAGQDHHTEKEFNDVIIRFSHSLQKITDLQRDVKIGQEITESTTTIEEYAVFYRKAFQEFRRLVVADHEYHARLLKDYRALILYMPEIRQAQVPAKKIESYLWDMFFLHERVYHHRDISGFPELKEIGVCKFQQN